MKNSKSQKVNMFFSAFLVCAYLICTYFITDYAQNILGGTVQQIVMAALFVVFGLFLFYATRVGDGKPVYRFSLAVLIFMILPSIYIILCNFIEVLPLSNLISSTTSGQYTTLIAQVVFGYSLPYAFVSGFEMAYDEDIEELEDDTDDKEIEVLKDDEVLVNEKNTEDDKTEEKVEPTEEDNTLDE